MCSARSDGLRKTLRHLEFVENGVAGAAYGRRRDRVREVVFWCRDARIWQLRWSRRHAPPPGCLLGACGASGPARARRWRRRVDSAVPPCRRDPRRSAADAGRIWLAPTSYMCRRPLRSRWGRRASISRCCVTRGRLTEPAGRRRLAARSGPRRPVADARGGRFDSAATVATTGHFRAVARLCAPPPPMRYQRRASSQGAVTTSYRRCALALRHRLRSHGGATAPADAPSRPDAPGRRVRRKISHVRCCQKSISRWIFGLLPLIFG